MSAGSWIPPRSLLYPAWRSLANRLQRLDQGDRGKVIGASLLVAAVWLGLFLGIRRLLQACYSVELFGEYLVDRLLALLFLAFSGILLFSNVVTSLASYYLSDDLNLLNAAPLDRLRIFYARLVQTLFGSSWMVALFGAPVLIAYGTLHHSGPGYYLLCLLLVPAYLLLPAAAGVVLTTVLVNVFPARRARDLLMILGLVFLGVAFVVFRMIRPERLVDPNAFGSLAEFFGSLSVPQGTFLPSTWVTRALTLAMRGRSGWLEPALDLVLSAGAAIAVTSWVTVGLYFSGWSKAQEGRRAFLSRFQGDLLARAASRLLGARAGAILAKDARSFFRDAGQWSQLLLLVALIVIYLLSIKALPFDTLTFPTAQYRNAVAFLNLGMGGFVLAALSARFLFTAVSAEARGIWIVRAAPMSAMDLLRAKVAGGLFPLIATGELISIVSNRLLHSSGFLTLECALTTAVIGAAVAALAVGLGAQMPNFKAENVAKVAAGWGGIVFMASALAYLGAVVLLEAYPTWLISEAALLGPDFARRQWMALGGCYAGVLVLSAAVGVTAMRRGAAALDAREYG